jgi:hypothetical protein
MGRSSSEGYCREAIDKEKRGREERHPRGKRLNESEFLET